MTTPTRYSLLVSLLFTGFCFPGTVISKEFDLMGNWIQNATPTEKQYKYSCNRRINGRIQCINQTPGESKAGINFMVNGMEVVADDLPHIVGTYDGNSTIKWLRSGSFFTVWRRLDGGVNKDYCKHFNEVDDCCSKTIQRKCPQLCDQWEDPITSSNSPPLATTNHGAPNNITTTTIQTSPHTTTASNISSSSPFSDTVPNTQTVLAASSNPSALPTSLGITTINFSGTINQTWTTTTNKSTTATSQMFPFTTAAPNIKWGDWSEWSSCSIDCAMTKKDAKYARQFRTRKCRGSTERCAKISRHKKAAKQKRNCIPTVPRCLDAEYGGSITINLSILDLDDLDVPHFEKLKPHLALDFANVLDVDTRKVKLELINQDGKITTRSAHTTDIVTLTIYYDSEVEMRKDLKIMNDTELFIDKLNIGITNYTDLESLIILNASEPHVIPMPNTRPETQPNINLTTFEASHTTIHPSINTPSRTTINSTNQPATTTAAGPTINGHTSEHTDPTTEMPNYPTNGTTENIKNSSSEFPTTSPTEPNITPTTLKDAESTSSTTLESTNSSVNLTVNAHAHPTLNPQALTTTDSSNDLAAAPSINAEIIQNTDPNTQMHNQGVNATEEQSKNSTTESATTLSTQLNTILTTPKYTESTTSTTLESTHSSAYPAVNTPTLTTTSSTNEPVTSPPIEIIINGTTLENTNPNTYTVNHAIHTSEDNAKNATGESSANPTTEPNTSPTTLKITELTTHTTTNPVPEGTGNTTREEVANPTTAPHLEVCKTKDDQAPNPNTACQFPFRWKGKMYRKCTTVDHFDNKPWCGTKPEVRKNETSQLLYGVTQGWGHCEDSEACHIGIDIDCSTITCDIEGEVCQEGLGCMCGTAPSCDGNATAPLCNTSTNQCVPDNKTENSKMEKVLSMLINLLKEMTKSSKS